jgi:Amidohydrolase
MAEIEPGEYIDTYINVRSKERRSEENLDPGERRWFLKSSPDILGGFKTEHWVNKMTAAGVERGLLNYAPHSLGKGSGVRQPTVPNKTVALLQKHANFRLMTAGFAPKYVPEEIIYTLNTRAQHKVMFSADYPVHDFQRCVDEAVRLPLRPGVLRRYMRENALKTFRME